MATSFPDPTGDRWDWFSDAAEKLGSRTGWSRRGLAVGLGVIAAAALPPIHAVPVLLVSFPCLIWLINGAPNWKRAFWDGWWFGLGHFTAGLYWIAHSLLVDLRFAWLIPFAVLCIPAVIGFYIGAVTALARLAPAGVSRTVVFAALWTCFEWLRGQLFTGFPWNSIGSVWAFSDIAMQLAAYVGILGLGLLTVFASASLATIAKRKPTVRWRQLIPFIASVVILFGVGGLRLTVGEPVQFEQNTHLRIVQPNIPQRLKWLRSRRDEHLQNYLDLSRGSSDRPITLLIWPETAVPFVMTRDAKYRKISATAAPENGLLLTGSVRTTDRNVKPFKIWNSLHAVSPRGEIVMTHDKFHLVPFGEYIPFSRFLKTHLGLEKITAGRTDFSPGPGPRTIKLMNIPSFSPLICYEVIFQDGIIGPGERPKWLLNITNDAWFGTSSGPFQHFAMARFRSVEQGLPLIRAANTGISAVIDPYGRVIRKLSLNTRGKIDSALPSPLRKKTLYSSVGDMPVLIIAITVIIALIWRRRRDDQP
ncbi:MAG: apolipoprotein N-acyltransferase [Rhodospirillaceae bacterium]|nr:apolipoprotein N-acyltransferase [Rhodospirillaceae bacterium]|tara:strand:+ start:35048 stop:36646 length:1599 start_codon:yes stop_codon:yes gene_type:complete